MPLDVENFLATHGIPYQDRGKNVAQGHVVIRCPFCGTADPSMHMGIRLSDGAWACWRNKGHRGRSFVRLVAAVLGISLSRAEHLVGRETNFEVDEFDSVRSRVLALWSGESYAKEEGTVDVPLPEGAVAINREADARTCDIAASFLGDKRGFGPAWMEMAEDYELALGTIGEWVSRLLIPYHYGGRRVGYTGRFIGSATPASQWSSRPRYKALSKDETAYPTSRVVYRPPDSFYSGYVLIVTEGPLDALKVDFFAKTHGVRATCLFGLSYSEHQIYDLLHLAESFDDVWVCLDRGAETNAYLLAEELLVVAPGILWLPEHADDPGDLNANEIDHLARRLLCTDARLISL